MIQIDEKKIIEEAKLKAHSMRFHIPYADKIPVFGSDWFALKAEGFARFFGTPIFLALQTTIVIIWISLNLAGFVHFDLYPFILLNLAFSLQSAYAAPLILLAQTRQADRDKALSEADAQHREALAVAAEERQKLGAVHSQQLLDLLNVNTELTRTTHELSLRIEALTKELHDRIKPSTSP
jgi:uncharacterized membrane protein